MFISSLKTADATFQNLDSSEISLTDVSHYFDSDPTNLVTSLRGDGKKPSAYIADTTTANAQVCAVPSFAVPSFDAQGCFFCSSGYGGEEWNCISFVFMCSFVFLCGVFRENFVPPPPHLVFFFCFLGLLTGVSFRV